MLPFKVPHNVGFTFSNHLGRHGFRHVMLKHDEANGLETTSFQ